MSRHMVRVPSPIQHLTLGWDIGVQTYFWSLEQGDEEIDCSLMIPGSLKTVEDLHTSLMNAKIACRFRPHDETWNQLIADKENGGVGTSLQQQMRLLMSEFDDD